MIPLLLKLKKQGHKNVANAQDLLVKEIYKIFDKAIIHGGTAIWRCYKGNRFSEDVDVYIPKDAIKLERLFENLKKSGFLIEKKKIGNNSLFSSLQISRTRIRFEALFKETNGTLKEYETTDGNLIIIYTLSPEELIKEKCAAYIKRLKIRDLYDVFFLLRYVKDIKSISKNLIELVKSFKKPSDEKDLKVLIIEGIVPETEKMIKYIEEKTNG